MAKRIDSNQTQIVKQLRKIGYSVCILSSVGKGVPDLLVGYRGKNLLIEIKDGSKPPSQRKLTPDEQNFHNTWNGSVIVARGLMDIIEWVW